MLLQRDYKYFNFAKSIALLSDFNKFHIGCVAVYKGKVLSVGFNTNKTCPLQKRFNKYRNDYEGFIFHKTHAEISCLSSIWNLDIDWGKVKLYIYRIRHDIPFGISRPCSACLAAIREKGIKNIYYTTDSGFINEIIC